MTTLLTDEQRAQLLENGRKARDQRHPDPQPVVKLFTPDAGATWLLTEIDPENPDLASGLCDLGHGCPALGWVSLAELAAVRGPLGPPIEQDRSTSSRCTCSRSPIGCSWIRTATPHANVQGFWLH
ncbi:MAG: DUF2958 domain-containing protein [Pseudacidovorax sp.]|uniref:DUF2958 domain-containing protein n=1 Tax=Pseudacidovorax sp. TaxID=1934311 RepID=UPI001B451FE1|nr:DUF2958 domain-containing protein [Pseudacidovorax sp.]MBP6892885.1 DUF2958 domain-containing protein [Pseudacidovorax sp.]